MVQNTLVNGFRSVILTILLVVMAIQMVLPIYSHHWFNASGWRTYTVLEVGRRPHVAAQPGALSQDHPVLRSGDLSLGNSVPVEQPMLLVIAHSTGESPLLLSLQFIWAGNEIRFDLFDPRHWVFHIASPPYRDVHLPPEGIPPQPAHSIAQL
jgi:hypothetical protein